MYSRTTMQLYQYPVFLLMVLHHVKAQWTSYDPCPANCLNSATCIYQNMLQCTCVPEEVMAAVAGAGTDDGLLCMFIVYSMELPVPSCCSGYKRAISLNAKPSFDLPLTIGDGNLRWPTDLTLKQKKDSTPQSKVNMLGSLNNILLEKAMKLIQELREELRQKETSLNTGIKLNSLSETPDSKLYQALRCFSVPVDGSQAKGLVEEHETKKQ